MTTSDFFADKVVPDGWGGTTTSQSLDVDRLVRLRSGPEERVADVDVAVALLDLVYDNLLLFGTGGGEKLTNEEMRAAIRTLHVLTARCGYPLALPFKDHFSWKGYWLENDGYGSWQARRDLLSKIFDEHAAKLVAAQDRSLSSDLANSISPHEKLGWTKVDVELGEVRRHFREARTPQDYRGVGNDCVHVLEALSNHVYEPARHTPQGEINPPVQSTKIRIERYISDRLRGKENEPFRKLAKASIDAAQQVKHSREPTRTEAGIAADAVVLLSNILRRLSSA